MPTRKTSKQIKSVTVPPEMTVADMQKKPSRRSVWKPLIVVLVVLFLVLLGANKGWVVAAVVDGKPIFSWQLNTILRQRYGAQTLEGLIGEQLIASEAKKQGVSVTQKDIEQRQNEVLSSMGTDVSLDDFLQFQGLTKEDFQHQLMIQLTVEQLLTKDMKVTDAEVDAYIASNSATLTATEPAKLREEATQAIRNNAVSEKLQTWFTDLRQKAAVMKFL